MPSGETVRGGAAQVGGRSSVSGAILFATAPAAGGGPAAALAYDGTTPLRRLLDQFASIGVTRAWVITRPDYAAALEPSLGGAAVDAEIVECAGPPEDLEAVARIAGERRGGLVLCYAEIVTHREALAGLIADPRLGTGALTRRLISRHTYCFATRCTTARVLSAASPYHWVGHGNTFFLGVLRVDPGDEPALLQVAERATALLSPPLRDDWLAEVDRKASVDEHHRRTRPSPPPGKRPVTRVFDRAVAMQDVLSLLLVGLVRGGTRVGNRQLRWLFWDRMLSEEDSRRAAEDIRSYDEDKVLLDSAVKANDGFFTTFFVSPYSRYIARFAAQRGFTPNQITVFSMLLGVLAAAGFATGERWGLVAGALVLQAAFTFDCVDGQLARYTRTFSPFGAWLDSVFDRGKEYLVYAGLAIGSTRGFGVDAWPLAALALTLQTTRHMFDFSFGQRQTRAVEEATAVPLETPGDGTRSGPTDVAALRHDEPEPAPAKRPSGRRRSPIAAAMRFSRRIDRAPGVQWVKKIVVLPIGERFALISLTAALFTPRTTFVALLVGGGFASIYALSSRVMQTVLSS
jgi:Family of unknown function (DUF5941)/CDP-alcohol phosphatidyltransferase